MISEGAWITLAVSSAGIFGTAITAILKSRGATNGNCPAHSGLVTDISYLREGQARIESTVDEIRKDVKGLLKGEAE